MAPSGECLRRLNAGLMESNGSLPPGMTKNYVIVTKNRHKRQHQLCLTAISDDDIQPLIQTNVSVVGCVVMAGDDLQSPAG